ncbi:putative uncharacterized protein DDB_G0268364 [Bacillus rossius redtenbacheri]|uniref:putative uncharacterized protein DDB_G0268364 n=1 Tax=Bacillus rossius redtenbacheri TaxID=93214 RepID=UPI002FDDCAA9
MEEVRELEESGAPPLDNYSAPAVQEQDDHRYAATYSNSINVPREQLESAVTLIPAKSPNDSDEEQSEEEEEFQGVGTAETSVPTAGTAATTVPAVNSMTTQPPRITDMSQLLQQLRLIIQIEGQQTASQLHSMQSNLASQQKEMQSNLASQQQEVQSNLSNLAIQQQEVQSNLNNLASQQQEMQSNLASQQQDMQANLTSQINSQNAEMRQHIDSKMDLLNSRLQEGLTELEERIETKLQDQSQSMTELKRGGSLEAHIVTMYERTRYLDIVMSDEEFIATMLTQLPVAYQIQMSGHAYKDVTEFRDHVLAVDKLQRLQKGQASKEESEKPSQPAYQNPWSIEQLDRTKWKPPCYIIK